MTSTTAHLDAAAPPAGGARARATDRSRRAWLLAAALVAGLTAARMPQVSDRVDAELASGPMEQAVGELPDAQLAVAIGTTTGLVLSIALKVLVMAAGAAVERRTRRAGHVPIAGRRWSLAYVVVVGTLTTTQIVPLALGLEPSGVEPWSVAAAAVIAVGAALATTDARWAPGRRVLLALALAAVCLAV